MTDTNYIINANNLMDCLIIKRQNKIFDILCNYLLLSYKLLKKEFKKNIQI